MKTWTDKNADALNVAQAFLAADNPRAAIREAARVLETDVDGVAAFSALNIIAHAEYDLRNFARTREIGERLIELAPHRVQGYTHAAFAALETSKYAKVDAMVTEGLAIDPRSAPLMVCAARRWRMVDKYAEAEAWARRALALDPTRRGALIELALAQAGQGRQSDAKWTTDSLRALDPASYQSLMVEAFNAFNSFKFNEAEQLSLAALAMRPNHRGLQETLKLSRLLKSPLFAPVSWVYKVTQLNVWQCLFTIVVFFGLVWLSAKITPLLIGVFWFKVLIAGLALWIIGGAAAALLGMKRIEKSMNQ